MFGVCVYTFYKCCYFLKIITIKVLYGYFPVFKYPFLMQLIFSINGSYRECFGFMCIVF